MVRGREQMTVRLFGASAVQEPSVSLTPTGTQYLEARRLAAQAPSSPEIDAVRAAVEDLVGAERLEAGAGRIRMYLYHLVKAGQAAAYRARVEALRETHTTMNVSVSGPWPAFAFAPELLP
jgi:hypothetical protein